MCVRKKSVLDLESQIIQAMRLEKFAHGLEELMALPISRAIEEKYMSALKKQRIDLRLNYDDRRLIEEAAAMTNQTITQFMVSTASVRAAEVIEHHRRLVLNEESWNLVMDAISNPPAPNSRLKRAAKRLQNME